MRLISGVLPLSALMVTAQAAKLMLSVYTDSDLKLNVGEKTSQGHHAIITADGELSVENSIKVLNADGSLKATVRTFQAFFHRTYLPSLI